jgi:hypothetical protein
MRLSSELVTPVYNDVINNSGHTIDDIHNNGYYDSNCPTSRITLFKKQFLDFSWNEEELFTNMVHPTIATKNFGLRADNLKVHIFQSPLNHKFNNIVIALILCYILSGRGYKYRDMLRAQRDGRILGIDTLLDYCNKVGFDHPDFISKLLLLEYGKFNAHIPIAEVKTKRGPRMCWGHTVMSADAFVKNELVTLRKTIKQKQ